MTASWVLLISIFVLIVICIVLLCIKKIRDNRIVLYIVIPLLIGIVLLLGQWCFRYNFENPINVIDNTLIDWGLAEPEPTSTPTPIPTPTVYVEPTFEKRTSETFNYTIECPSNFELEGSLQQDTENDFNLTSEDRRATLNFIARYVDDELPDLFVIDTFRRTYGGTELYRDDQLENDGWYVISSKTADGYFHYRKCIFTNGIARMYTFSFPTDQEDIYLKNYDYVTHIENSFRKLK